MTSPHDRLRAALEAESHYAPYRLVLALGREFKPRPPSASTPAGEYMNCFHSAYTLASHQSFRYCEGWATTRTAPTWLSRPHAWCVDDDGNVIDPAYVGRASYDVVAYRGVFVPLEVAQPYVHRGSRVYCLPSRTILTVYPLQ